jgi:acyl transferase domain-containing protein
VEGPETKLFLLSARDKVAVTKIAADLREHLGQRSGLESSLGDLAYTLCERRTRFPWTWSAVAANAEELTAALADTAILPVQNHGTAPRLGFVFNGQGAQWYAMGRELSAAYPVYKQTLDKCDQIIHSFGASWSLVGKCFGCRSSLSRGSGRLANWRQTNSAAVRRRRESTRCR